MTQDFTPIREFQDQQELVCTFLDKSIATKALLQAHNVPVALAMQMLQSFLLHITARDLIKVQEEVANKVRQQTSIYLPGDAAIATKVDNVLTPNAKEISE